MAGICSLNPTTLKTFKRIQGIRCCTGAPDKNENKSQTRSKTPQILKLVVSGVTELLRVFSFSSTERLKKVNDRDEISVSGIDDVIMILKSDYENAYFVTGVFTSAIYAGDCIFEDPTIKFQGTELYSRNLKLLVPFFDCPSIVLQNIEKVASFEPIPDIFDSEHYFRQHILKSSAQLIFQTEHGLGNLGVNSKTYFVVATWKLRTYLKFPWRPLISIDGSTVYELDDKFKIVRHAESWNVSALEAIGQIFTPSFDRLGD